MMRSWPAPSFRPAKRPGFLIEVAIAGQHLDGGQAVLLPGQEVVFAMPRRGMHNACAVGRRDIIGQNQHGRSLDFGQWVLEQSRFCNR